MLFQRKNSRENHIPLNTIQKAPLKSYEISGNRKGSGGVANTFSSSFFVLGEGIFFDRFESLLYERGVVFHFCMPLQY